MRFRDVRSYSAVEEKTEGIFRILCLGDSMVYGHGVHSRETLPARLEMFLNRAVWNLQIEVINEGKCGYSVYDEINQFIQRGYRYRPDLAVMILCENDAEMFGVNKNYPEHVQKCWDEDSPHLAYFRKAVEDIRKIFILFGIPIVVCFYYIFDNALKKRCADSIKKICNDFQIDFVDLSVDFVGNLSGLVNSDMRASLIDGHPSAQAHQIAAQRLARSLISKGYFSRNASPLIPEHDLYRHLILNADKMYHAGYPIDTILNQMLALLELKRSSNAKLKLPDDFLMRSDEFECMMHSVREEIKAYKYLLFWEAYAWLLKRNRKEIRNQFLSADNEIQSVLKRLFFLEKKVRNPELQLANVSPNGHMEDYDVSELLGKLNSWSEQLGRLSTKLDAHLSQANDLQNKETLNSISNSILLRLQTINKVIHEYWNESDRLISAFIRSLDFIGMVQLEMSNGPEDPEMLDNLSFAKRTTGKLIINLGNLLSLLYIDEFSVEDSLLTQSNVMQLEVKAKSNPPDQVNLVVELDSAVPDHPIVQDSRLLINDGETHTYAFEFPFFTAGGFTLKPLIPGKSIGKNNSFRIEEVRIRYYDRETVFSERELINNADQSITTPSVFIPLGLILGNGKNSGSDCDRVEGQITLVEYELDSGYIQKESGFCYLYLFKTVCGRMFTFTQTYSELTLYENGVPLNSPNALHDEIRNFGNGYYSLWHESIFFSSSDNSDPRTNGRRYTIKLPTYVCFLEKLPEEQIQKWRF